MHDPGASTPGGGSRASERERRRKERDQTQQQDSLHLDADVHDGEAVDSRVSESNTVDFTEQSASRTRESTDQTNRNSSRQDSSAKRRSILPMLVAALLSCVVAGACVGLVVGLVYADKKVSDGKNFYFSDTPTAPPTSPPSAPAAPPTSPPSAPPIKPLSATPSNTPTAPPTKEDSLYPLDKIEIDQACSLGIISADNGQRCREACEPQFSQCCRPYSRGTDPVGANQTQCGYDTHVADCIKYAKCQVLSDAADPAPSTLPVICGRERVSVDPTACQDICEPVQCCFSSDTSNCLVDFFAECSDYADCQNLRNGTILETAPADLYSKCSTQDTECFEACEASECCRTADPESSCLRDNLMSCLTYSACPRTNETISISLPFSVLSTIPSSIAEACIPGATDGACSAICQEASCCWDSTDNCYLRDPLGCLAWEQWCILSIRPVAQCGATKIATEWLSKPIPLGLGPGENIDLPDLPEAPSTPCSQDSTCSLVMEALEPVVSNETLSLLNVPGTCQNWSREWLRTGVDILVFTVQRIQQRFAMAMLYCELDGQNWLDAGLWVSDLHECDWYTTIGADPCGRQENLQLFRNKGQHMSGTLPQEISILTSLWEFTISDNLLSGSLPEGLRRLRDLDTLSLSFNLFTGPLPAWVWTFQDLVYLDLAYNFFTGTIPAKVPLFASKLATLFLENNGIFGSIPTDFGQLDWKRLSMGGNRLTGKIPSNLHSPSLQVLMLHNNQLTGTFPTGPFVNDTSSGNSPLHTLTLYHNEITGSVEDMCQGNETLVTFAVDVEKVLCSCCDSVC